MIGIHLNRHVGGLYTVQHILLKGHKWTDDQGGELAALDECGQKEEKRFSSSSGQHNHHVSPSVQDLVDGIGLVRTLELFVSKCEKTSDDRLRAFKRRWQCETNIFDGMRHLDLVMMVVVVVMMDGCG